MDILPTHSMYFIAILCPPGLDKKILQFKYWMKDHVGTVVALKAPAHITFIQPFWLEESKEEKLKQHVASFTIDRSELEIRLDGFSHFENRVLFVRVLPDPRMEELQKQVEDHFALLYGDLIKKDGRPFHPHISIANRDLRPGDFDKAWQHFSTKKFTENFSSKTISLLKLIEGKWNAIGEKKWS